MTRGWPLALRVRVARTKARFWQGWIAAALPSLSPPRAPPCPAHRHVYHQTRVPSDTCIIVRQCTNAVQSDGVLKTRVSSDGIGPGPGEGGGAGRGRATRVRQCQCWSDGNETCAAGGIPYVTIRRGGGGSLVTIRRQGGAVRGGGRRAWAGTWRMNCADEDVFFFF